MAEKRLIDAYALQNILLPIITALEHEYGSLGGAVSGCMKHIDNAPTVDAVEVVRCKDCKHWLKDFAGCSEFVGRCDYANYMIGANGYCLYGEKMEKGADNG